MITCAATNGKSYCPNSPSDDPEVDEAKWQLFACTGVVGRQVSAQHRRAVSFTPVLSQFFNGEIMHYLTS